MSIFGHQHHYEAIAVEDKTSQVIFQPPVKATIVLYRCGCNDVYSKTIEGEWTLSQVRGEMAPTDRERIETDLAIADALSR